MSQRAREWNLTANRSREMPWKPIASGVAVIVLAALILGAWDFVLTTKTFMAVVGPQVQEMAKDIKEIKDSVRR